MKENLHDIDKLFRAALENQAEPPSSTVWDAIDKKLDKTRVVEINMKYARLKKIAITLLVLLMGAGVYTWKTTREFAKYDNKTSIKQDNSTNSLTNSQNRQDNLIISNILNTDETLKTEINKKDPGKQERNANGLLNTTDGTENTALKNLPGSSGQKVQVTLAGPGGGKIIINKKSKKIIIINAGQDEEENRRGSAISDINKDKLTPYLSTLSWLNPEIIKSGPTNKIKENNFRGRYNLPKDLYPTVVPNKIIRAKVPPSLTATVFFAPNIASNNIKDGKHKIRPGRPGDSEDKIRNGEQHQFSYTFGMLIDYNLNKHLGIQSGKSVSNKTIRISPKTIYADFDNYGNIRYLYNCSSGYLFLSSKSVANLAVGDSIQAFESTNTLQYVSIPLALKYNYSLGKLDLFASIGASLYFLTLDKIETGIGNGLNKEESTTTKINGLKSRYSGANLGMGASYNITDRIAVSFMPSYNFALTSGTRDAMVKTYPNTISLAAGIRYKL